MADNYKVATFYKDGEEVTDVTAEQFKNAALNYAAEIDKVIESNYTMEPFGPGVLSIDIHPGIGDDLTIIKPGSGGSAVIKYGQYLIIENAFECESEEQANENKPIDGSILLIHDQNDVIESDFDLFPISVYHAKESAGEGSGVEITEKADVGEYWAMRNPETGEFVTLADLISAIFYVSVLQLLSEQMGISAEVDDKSGPMMVRNGKFFTEAMRGRRKKNDIWPIDESYFVAEIGALKMTAADERALDTAIGSSKTLIYLNAAATASKYSYNPDKVCRVNASMSDLLDKRNLKNTKKNRAKIRQEVNALAGVSWTMKNDKTGEFLTVPLAGGKCGARGDEILFTFSPDFMGAVLNREAGRMPTNPALLGTDDVKNPHAVALGWKLSTHSYQNAGKPNENTLSVARLLDFADGIPSYEAVKETDRAYTRRIIEPLERDLDHLAAIGFLDHWDYCHEKGEPLTDEEQAQRLDADGEECALPYETAINANIQWKLTEAYPEQMEQTEKAREKKREAAEAAKQRNAERQKRIDRKIESNIAKEAAKKKLAEDGD